MNNKWLDQQKNNIFSDIYNNSTSVFFFQFKFYKQLNSSQKILNYLLKPHIQTKKVYFNQ